MIIKLFYISPVQCDIHWLYVAKNNQNITSSSEKLSFTFYFILINLNFNTHIFLIATELGSTALQTEFRF